MKKKKKKNHPYQRNILKEKEPNVIEEIQKIGTPNNVGHYNEIPSNLHKDFYPHYVA